MKKTLLNLCAFTFIIIAMATNVSAMQSKVDDNIDMAVKSIKLDDYAEINKKVILGASITNKGNVTITSYDLNYKIDGGEQVTIKFKDQSFNPNGVKTVTFIDSLKFQTVGVYVIELSITNINEQVDSTPSDNVMTKKIIAYKDSVKRKLLMEQFSTERCVECPKGTAELHAVADDNADIIWVTHHAGFYTDSFTIKADTDLLPLYNKGGSTYAPAVMLDRTGNPPVMGTSAASKNMISQMLSVPAFISIKIDGIYDYDTGELKLMVYGDVLEVPNENLMLTVYLIEDAIEKTGQAGYSGVYTHNNVCRAALTGSWGQNVNFAKGEEFYSSFTTKIKSNWVVDNMRVVAFVNNYNKTDVTNCKIYNVEHALIADLANFVQKYRVTLEGNMVKPVDEEVEYTLAGEGLYEVGGNATITASIKSTNKNIKFVNWTLNGNEISTEPSYKFTVKDGDGDMKYVANFKDTSVSVSDIIELSVSVYPNPAREIINIVGKYEVLNILDITGKIVKTAMGESSVSIVDLKEGVYILNIVGENANKTQKVIITK